MAEDNINDKERVSREIPDPGYNLILAILYTATLVIFAFAVIVTGYWFFIAPAMIYAALGSVHLSKHRKFKRGEADLKPPKMF